jgi:methionyl-tRNA formyltransferase
MKLKIAIIGSKKLASIITEWICKSQKVEIVGGMFPHFEVNWEEKFETTLEELNIPTFENLDALLQEKPDLIFSINYWKKINKSQISKVRFGIVNIHHSYLLKYKGRYSTSWAILNARRLNCWEHGTSIHFINENLDEGRIIDSWKCEITEKDTAESLFEKTEKLAFEMFKSNFDRILSPIDVFKEQEKESFFYDKYSNNLEIPLDADPLFIYDFVRAWTFKNKPKPYMKINGKKLFLSLEE